MQCDEQSDGILGFPAVVSDNILRFLSLSAWGRLSQTCRDHHVKMMNGNTWQAKLLKSPLLPKDAFMDAVFKEHHPDYRLFVDVLNQTESLLKYLFSKGVFTWQLMALMGMHGALVQKYHREIATLKDDNGYFYYHYFLIGGHFHLYNEHRDKLQPDIHAPHLAASCGHILFIEQLIKEGFDPNSVTPEYNRSILHDAVMYGKIEMVSMLIQKYKVDPTLGDLHIVAAKNGNWHLYNLLLKHIVKPYSDWGNTLDAVYASAEHGNLELLDNLSKFFMSVERADIVSCAIQGGQFKVVQYAISRGWWPSIEHRFNGGKTMLHIAAEYGQLSLIYFLLEEYPTLFSLDDKDDEGNTVRHYAALHGDWFKYRGLFGIPKNLTPNNNGQTEAHLAASNGKISFLKQLVHFLGKDILYAKDNSNRGLFPYAVASLHLQLMDWLLDDCDLPSNETDNNGENSLFMLARKCQKSSELWCKLTKLTDEPEIYCQTNKDGVSVYTMMQAAKQEGLLEDMGINVQHSLVL